MTVARKASALAIAACLVLGHAALTAADASAASGRGGYKGCISTQHVVTSSKSAGYTSHTHYKGSGSYGWSFGNVSPSNPYRNYHGQLFRSIDSWYAYGQVLESYGASCAPNPV